MTRKLHIVTTNHVINGASKVDIFVNGRTKKFGGEIKRCRYRYVVIKSLRESHKQMNLSDSSQLTRRETAAANRCPPGSECANNTVTQGICIQSQSKRILKIEDGQAISTKMLSQQIPPLTLHLVAHYQYSKGDKLSESPHKL